MKIAFVNSTNIWSGVKTWMVEFGNELHKRGHEVFIYAKDPKMIAEVVKNGCNGIQVKFGADYNPIKIAYFMREFVRQQIDITCMNIQKELRTAGISAKLLKIPVVQRLGLPTDINFKLDQRFAQKFIVDEILVTSRYMADETAGRFSFTPRDKFRIVYNAKRVLNGPKSQMNRPVKFVMTARLAEGKGHQHLVEAFRNLKQSGVTNFICDIYGDGPLMDTIKSHIHEGQLDNLVTLKGFSRNLKQVLPEYDFGLLTSDLEGLPNTVIEYLSAALPVIATDIGGNSELVAHEKNGFLYQYGDISMLTQHLLRCLEMDEQSYRLYSQQSHQLMTERFDLDKNVITLENYFLDCIKRFKGG